MASDLLRMSELKTEPSGDKENGDRELFDRVKLANSTRRSVGKFFKSDEEVDNIITAVEDSLYALGESEVTVKTDGDQVLDELEKTQRSGVCSFC